MSSTQVCRKACQMATPTDDQEGGLCKCCLLHRYKKGCVTEIQCNGTDDSLDRWRTLDASLLDMEGADEQEVMVINMVKAAVERLPHRRRRINPVVGSV
jgi:hypothetical protein